MSFLEAFKFIISFLSAIKKYILMLKKKEIISVKNEALEKGDQRDLENIISSDNSGPADLPINKYSGMYERHIKKKS